MHNSDRDSHATQSNLFYKVEKKIARSRLFSRIVQSLLALHFVPILFSKLCSCADVLPSLCTAYDTLHFVPQGHGGFPDHDQVAKVGQLSGFGKSIEPRRSSSVQRKQASTTKQSRRYLKSHHSMRIRRVSDFKLYDIACESPVDKSHFNQCSPQYIIHQSM